MTYIILRTTVASSKFFFVKQTVQVINIGMGFRMEAQEIRGVERGISVFVLFQRVFLHFSYSLFFLLKNKSALLVLVYAFYGAGNLFALFFVFRDISITKLIFHSHKYYLTSPPPTY